MEIQEFQTLLPNFKELQRKIVAEKGDLLVSIQNYLDEYDPSKHAITDKGKRPDKVVTTNESTSLVPVARLPIPYQKKIVLTRATFLCGNPVQLISQPTDQTQKNLQEVLQRTWDDNKLDYESKGLVKLLMSETEVAELWYTEVIEPGYWINTANNIPSVMFRLRMKILSNSKGDSLYPVFNNKGDMIAFGRGYKLKVEGKGVEHFDIYTDKTNYFAEKSTASDWDVKPEQNKLLKIPVIYYSQKLPEWSDVQALIDRKETLHSNHADTNDYMGSPSYFVTGEITGWAKKGEQGKVFEGTVGSDVKVVSWDQSPASVKLESETLDDNIYYQSGTPKLSFENLKGIGTVSGIALKLMFMDAHMHAADKEEIFGKGIQRRINFLKAALVKINTTLEAAVSMTIKPKFEYYLPKNVDEMITTLVNAVAGKAVMSTQTAVEQNPLVQDPEEEMTRLQEDQNTSLTITDLLPTNGVPSNA